jgi:3-carboxy-cis,cis-muconate cycloisomerase
MAKIALDITLMAQTEVAEVHEAMLPGKGGSSAMPHKHNPVDATMALAAARLAFGQVPVVLAAMTQEHERATGGWQAEWQALPDLTCYAGGAVARVADAVGGISIDVERMRANLDVGGALLMAEALTITLAHHSGRAMAQRLVQAACARAAANGQALASTALDDPAICAILSADAINAALDPATYLGSADRLIERALASYHALLAP